MLGTDLSNPLARLILNDVYGGKYEEMMDEASKNPTELARKGANAIKEAIMGTGMPELGDKPEAPTLRPDDVVGMGESAVRKQTEEDRQAALNRHGENKAREEATPGHVDPEGKPVVPLELTAAIQAAEALKPTPEQIKEIGDSTSQEGMKAKERARAIEDGAARLAGMIKNDGWQQFMAIIGQANPSRLANGQVLQAELVAYAKENPEAGKIMEALGGLGKRGTRTEMGDFMNKSANMEKFLAGFWQFEQQRTAGRQAEAASRPPPANLPGSATEQNPKGGAPGLTVYPLIKEQANNTVNSLKPDQDK
jgi:hypothetical protein